VPAGAGSFRAGGRLRLQSWTSTLHLTAQWAVALTIVPSVHFAGTLKPALQLIPLAARRGLSNLGGRDDVMLHLVAASGLDVLRWYLLATVDLS